ncbi:helix-turn-helix domain-containing protein [Nocardia stercoris]|uniref:XRE family transcriptional regulator n=1 Tax=Nocardia stercoris TaxID=2483361 RepID=A0A3M2L8Y1_9NOCA|nr:helix-turn-helix transcriptional regulator [Nocardia stercoris]RMI34039.1 XRE family transcriptional regulator [Nocardia stercoris]
MSREPANTTSTVPRRQLGKYLRDWRTQSGLTIADAARLMEWGASTLQRLETGHSDRIRLIDIRELCRIYGIPGEIAEGLEGLASQSVVQSWWHAYDDAIPESFDVYVGLEAAAQQFVSYRSELVPGLLQTADYARALYRLDNPDATDAEVERRVALRVQRQAPINRRNHPATVDVVLDESVLRRLVAGPRVMAAQLRHLADLSTREHVTLRVLPFAAGMPLGLPTGPYVILGFGTDAKGRAGEPPVVYVQGFTGELYLERAADVDRYRRAHAALAACALDVPETRRLLRQLGKEYAAA